MPASDAAVLRAFADAIREGLVHNRTVVVHGLGAFRREHQPSRFDDSVVPPRLLPPREVVLFAPDAPPPDAPSPGPPPSQTAPARPDSPADLA